MIIDVLIVFVILALPMLIFMLIDNMITIKRLEKNQKAWDDFSKNMTAEEKLRNYPKFCATQKVRNNWHYYYPPRMRDKDE